MASEAARHTRAVTTPRRALLVGLLSLLVALAALVLAALFGSTPVDLGKALELDPTSVDYQKVFRLRLPRALAASVVGACLAAAGLIFQALIRNPLASPYILGVSAGGSFGAVLAIVAGGAWLGPAAFLGAASAIVVVYAIARDGGRVPAHTLLLAGVVVNAFLTAAIMLVNILADPMNQRRILRWLVGGLRDHNPAETLGLAGAFGLVGCGALFFAARELNLLSLGDVEAERAGVRLGPVRTGLFLIASLLTAVAVSIAGPIGFVGLVVPHVLRLILGPDHRLLVPAAVFCGAAFLTLVDVGSRTLWESPLPAGVLTAFLGGPLFLFLLKRRDRARAGLDG